MRAATVSPPPMSISARRSCFRCSSRCCPRRTASSATEIGCRPATPTNAPTRSTRRSSRKCNPPSRSPRNKPMDPGKRQKAIGLYDRFTHERMDRRLFMAEMVKLAGSVAAAELLIAGIAASPAAAAVVSETDPRIITRTQTLSGGYKAYVAEPRSRSLKATVLVIHENRGLNDHIRDVARRVALAGYRAVAPDMLSPSGGTPANEDAAREAIGKLDLGRSVSDAVAIIAELKKSSRDGKVGAVGFCWGGGFVNRLAIAA